MKNLKHLILLFLTFLGNILLGQTVEYQGIINLQKKHKVYKIVTIPNCLHSYLPPAGTNTTIIYETKYKNDNTEIKIESILNSSGTSPVSILANKVYKLKLSPYANGKANLYLDEKDKTILYVNYLLNSKQTIPNTKIVQESTAVLNCDGTATYVSKPKRVLNDDEHYYLWKVNPSDAEENSTWFKSSDRITVFKNDGNTVDYYLSNRFDRNAKYKLELENRESISYKSNSLDFGALTIPFKYRFGCIHPSNHIFSKLT